MIITIQKVSNGYILKDDTGEYPDHIVIQEKEDGEVDAAVEMLNEVNQWVGEGYDKFGEENVLITKGKGHKLT